MIVDSLFDSIANIEGWPVADVPWVQHVCDPKCIAVDKLKSIFRQLCLVYFFVSCKPSNVNKVGPRTAKFLKTSDSAVQSLWNMVKSLLIGSRIFNDLLRLKE
jgi:hypothetical protein